MLALTCLGLGALLITLARRRAQAIRLRVAQHLRDRPTVPLGT